MSDNKNAVLMNNSYGFSSDFENINFSSTDLGIGVIVAAYIGGAVYEDVKLHPQILDFQKNQEGQEEEIEDLVQ